jgi:hypothetical protein
VINVTETSRIEAGGVIDQKVQSAESAASLVGEIVDSRIGCQVGRYGQRRSGAQLIEFIGQCQRRRYRVAVMDNEICTVLM